MNRRLVITKWAKDWFEVREAASMSNFGYYMVTDRRLSLYLVM